MMHSSNVDTGELLYSKSSAYCMLPILITACYCFVYLIVLGNICIYCILHNVRSKMLVISVATWSIVYFGDLVDTLRTLACMPVPFEPYLGG